MSDAWVSQLAISLNVEELSREEVSRLLAVARDVAHGVERRVTPLSAFLLGRAVERHAAAGTSRADALEAAITTLEGLIPDAQPDDVP